MRYKICFIVEIDHDKADFTEAVKQVILNLNGSRIVCTEGTSVLDIDPDSLTVEVVEDHADGS